MTRLKQIQEQMIDLLEEAKNIVRTECPNHMYERAKAYWLTSIERAVSKIHPYDCTM